MGQSKIILQYHPNILLNQFYYKYYLVISKRVSTYAVNKKDKMDADVKGALKNINKYWRLFEHRGEPMTKKQVLACLMYADTKGYKTTASLSDVEVDKVIGNLKTK